MTITDDARDYLVAFIRENNRDALEVNVLPTGCGASCGAACGTSLSFSLAILEEGDRVHSINGVPVLMDEAAQTRTETVMLSVKDSQLVMKDDRQGSCCGR